MQDHRGEHDTRHAAIRPIASQICCSGQTLRNWIKEAESSEGTRAALASDERERIKALEREVRELRQSNEILQGERLFCNGGTRPPITDMISFIDERQGAHGVEPVGSTPPAEAEAAFYAAPEAAPMAA